MQRSLLLQFAKQFLHRQGLRMVHHLYHHQPVIQDTHLQNHGGKKKKLWYTISGIIKYKQVTIATRCPSDCNFDIKLDFCSGFKDALILSFSIPTFSPILITASSLSPDKRNILIPS